MACINFQEIGLARTEVTNLIDEQILNERDREIMKRRHLDGVCFEDLSEAFELSVRQLKTIVYKYDNILIRHF